MARRNDPTDEELLTAIKTFERTGSKTSAATELGIARTTLSSRLDLAARRGFMGFSPVLEGFRLARTTTVYDKNGEVTREYVQQKPDLGEEFEVPEGHEVKGVSALVDGKGNVLQQWVKTRQGQNHLDIIEAIKSAFVDFKPASPRKPPGAARSELLNLIPCNDWHINLLVWGREAGENWDLQKAERVIGEGIVDAIQRSPSAARSIVLGGGDLLHADTNENRTAKSGNILEADGRHQKALEVACRLKVRTIDAALGISSEVIVRILKGNHDEYSSVAVAYFLLAYYRNEPRVTVDVDPSLFFWFRHGQTMLGATHGHSVKLQDMPQIMAHRKAEEWGATKHRYIHGFHVHHKSKFVTEGGGCIAESHQAPIPKDAWHDGAGYNAGRSFQTITYHQDHGEVSRVSVVVNPS